MPNPLDSSINLAEANRRTLESDLRLLEEIRARTGEVAENYRRLAATQKDAAREFKDNLKLFDQLASAISGNLDALGKGDARGISRDLLRMILQGKLARESGRFLPDFLAQGLGGEFSGSFLNGFLGGGVRSGAGQASAELFRLMQRAGRYL